MSGATMSCAAGGFGDIQTIVNGSVGIIPNRSIGWVSSVPIGSISPGSSAIYGGATILGMYFDESPVNYVVSISGVLPNSGWTGIVINRPTPVTFLRSAATFFQSGGAATWTWAAGTNPVGPTGSTYTVVFY